MQKKVTPEKKVIMLERVLKRIVGCNATFRYGESHGGWSDFDIVHPDAQRLLDCFQTDEYNTLDFDSELVEGDIADYWPFYQAPGSKKLQEGFPVYNETTGEMSGLSKKYTSVLVATIEQDEDPYDEIRELKKTVAALTPIDTPKKRGRKPKPEPTPASLERKPELGKTRSPETL